MSALNVLCAQLTRDLFAIAKFLFDYAPNYCNYLPNDQFLVDGKLAVLSQHT